MILMLIRVQQGTFIGQIKDSKLDRLYFPAMVDFMTMPIQSQFGKVEIKTTLHMADWPCSEMIIDSTPVLHSIIDTEEVSDHKKLFVDAYLQCINQVWKSRQIVN